MSALAVIPAVTGLLSNFIDRFVEDKDQAAKLKAEANAYAMQNAAAELQGAVSIIVAEAQGESWLQRNWRPITMLWFGGLVGAHWLGFTAENLSEAQILSLMDIVQVGIGGYVLGRSAEKCVKAYKK